MTESDELSAKKKASLQWRRDFAKRYEQARVDADLTYEAIGKHLGVSKSLCHHWANAVSEITAPQIAQLADLLNVDAGWLLSGRGVAKVGTRYLSMQDPAETFSADLVTVEIASNAVNGLSIGDEAVFNCHRTADPGDIVLAVIQGKTPLIGRYLAPSASSFQIATDDEREPHTVKLDEVAWRGVLSKRSKYGSR